MVIAELPSPVEREVYAMRVAEKTGVNKAVVTDEVTRARKRKAYNARKQEDRDTVRAIRSAAQPRDRSLRYENERSALAEEGVIRLMYLDPALFDRADISPEEFTSPLLGRFFGILREKAAAHTQLSMAALAGSFTGEEIDHLTAILQKPEVLANGEKALSDYIDTIRAERAAADAEDDLRSLAENLRNKKGYGG